MQCSAVKLGSSTQLVVGSLWESAAAHAAAGSVPASSLHACCAHCILALHSSALIRTSLYPACCAVRLALRRACATLMPLPSAAGLLLCSRPAKPIVVLYHHVMREQHLTMHAIVIHMNACRTMRACCQCASPTQCDAVKGAPKTLAVEPRSRGLGGCACVVLDQYNRSCTCAHCHLDWAVFQCTSG